jgi:hypothetical protein
MTTFSDETLMAFADEELDPATRATVEAAVRDDPDIERRVAQHRALRARVQRAFEADLDEAPPERLLAAARGVARPVSTPEMTGEPLSNLTDARAAGAARRAPRPAARFRRQPLVSMAASLLIGVGVGYFVLRHSDSIVTKNGGGLVASGALARALSNQLGSDRSPSAPVQVGLSFLSKSGDYCRTFVMPGVASPSGVACHHADDWQIRVLARAADGAAGDASPTNYRTAGSALPPAVLDAVQEQIAGEPLDPTGEARARQQGWHASGR